MKYATLFIWTERGLEGMSVCYFWKWNSLQSPKTQNNRLLLSASVGALCCCNLLSYICLQLNKAY